MLNTEVRSLTRFDPILCSMHHHRNQSAIIESVFYGQWKIQAGAGQYDPASIILTGDRYLYIRNVVMKNTFPSDDVANYIKNSKDRIYFIRPTPYLKESLKIYNRSFISPPMFAGEIGFKSNPKVKYTEIANLKELGNETSEFEDLVKLTTELIEAKKIVVSEFSNFRMASDSHKYSVVLLVKEVLNLLLGGDVELLSF